jgi:hypothetical protein
VSSHDPIYAKESPTTAGPTDQPYSTAGSESDMTPPAVTAPFAAATQRTLAAAGDQFNALTQFGSAKPVLSAKDRASAIIERGKLYEGLFVRDGVIQLNQHGLLSVLEFLRADAAIRAKAVALGYGVEAQAVAVESVPGGYVGRFGGHDIYAAAT